MWLRAKVNRSAQNDARRIGDGVGFKFEFMINVERLDELWARKFNCYRDT